MIQCSNCGYQNNDGSKICINCLCKLTSSSTENAEAHYISTVNEMKSAQQTKAGKAANRILLITLLVILIPAIVYIGVIYVKNNPVGSVDEKLVGTWSTKNITGEIAGTMSITWKFDEKGYFNGRETKYSAKNGKLIIGINYPSGLPRMEYNYAFGFSNGRECLMISDARTGKLRYLFYRVN